MKLSKLILPVVVLVALLPTHGFAATIGEMNLVSGMVKLTRQGQSEVYRGSAAKVAVEPGDRFQTGPDSIVKVSLRQGAEEVKLYSNTNFQVRNHNNEGVLFFLNLGKAYFGAHIKKIRTKFLVRTPTAAIGVKGTEFVVGVDPNSTYLYTVEGLVGFSSSMDPSQEVLVAEGQASSVTAGYPPTEPVPVDGATGQDILNSADSGVFQQINYGDPVGGTSSSTSDAAATLASMETAVDQQAADASAGSPLPSPGSGTPTNDTTTTDDGSISFDVKTR